MSETPSRFPSRSYQFGLAELLLWVTFAAVALSAAMVQRSALGPWFFLFALSFRWIYAHVWNMRPVGRRRAMQWKRALRAARLALPMMACLSLVVWVDTHFTRAIDGSERLGWPMAIYEFDGLSGVTQYDASALGIDIAVWVAIAAVIGFVLRDGGRRLATTMTRFARGRSPLPPRAFWREKHRVEPTPNHEAADRRGGHMNREDCAALARAESHRSLGETSSLPLSCGE